VKQARPGQLLGTDDKYKCRWSDCISEFGVGGGSMTAHVPPVLVSQESSGTGNTSDFNPELAQEKASFAI